VLVVRDTTSELETRDIDHPVICRCRNTDSWHARKGDLQCAFLWTF
jgi:hypothetical protein